MAVQMGTHELLAAEGAQERLQDGGRCVARAAQGQGGDRKRTSRTSRRREMPTRASTRTTTPANKSMVVNSP